MYWSRCDPHLPWLTVCDSEFVAVYSEFAFLTGYAVFRDDNMALNPVVLWTALSRVPSDLAKTRFKWWKGWQHHTSFPIPAAQQSSICLLSVGPGFESRRARQL